MLLTLNSSLSLSPLSSGSKKKEKDVMCWWFPCPVIIWDLSVYIQIHSCMPGEGVGDQEES